MRGPLAFLLALSTLLVLLPAAASADARDSAGSPLIDFSAAGSEKHLTPQDAQETVTRSADDAGHGALVTVQPGEHSYPGVLLKPDAGTTWDLSKYGHVAVRITNTGSKAIGASVRVDAAGRTATETGGIKPGETRMVTVFFNANFHRPTTPLDSKVVSEVLVFTGKANQALTYRIESIEVGGSPGEKPPVAPDDIRTVPKDGVLLGPTVNLSPTQIRVRGGAQANLEGSSVKVVFPATGLEAAATVQPVEGRWDLRDALEVRVRVRNGGTNPVSPRVQLLSKDGPGNTVAAEALAPGAETEIVIPFAADRVADPSDKPKLYAFSNDSVSRVSVLVDPSNGERALLVEAITADVPPVSPLPASLGKRPPVDGDWFQTLDQNFSGATLDATVWNDKGANFWDKVSHLSPQEVTVANGVATLRFEKKHGHENDDPANPRVNEYACGYLDSYGKWVQRYGYFEARMKLPTAPGLWPAFWLMPERGGKDPQWVRQSTDKDGMEFDIMEFLSRWGPFRYNIAMHWDGYGKNHRANGSEHNYVRPDKEGFITSGLLWTPGLAVYYANGKEIVRWENPRISSVPAQIIFTNVSGGWDNDSLDDARLPDDFVVDYVRVWQRKDLSSAADTQQTAVRPAP